MVGGWLEAAGCMPDMDMGMLMAGWVGCGTWPTVPLEGRPGSGPPCTEVASLGTSIWPENVSVEFITRCCCC